MNIRFSQRSQSFLSDPLLPVIRTLTLSPNCTIDPPSQRLLAVHRTIAFIIKLSGAGSYIEDILRFGRSKCKSRWLNEFGADFGTSTWRLVRNECLLIPRSSSEMLSFGVPDVCEPCLILMLIWISHPVRILKLPDTVLGWQPAALAI
jgi:hypothetical protein